MTAENREKAAAARAAAHAAARHSAAETSPWLTLIEAAGYEKRGPRYLRNEWKAGRLRGARVGGKGELLFRREWLDQHLEDQAQPVIVSVRRRA